jgi:predicted HicB family RNase H-like nuclease
MSEMFYRFECYSSIENGQTEYVVRYFDIPVIGAGLTEQEARDDAKENLDFYLEYCRDNNIPIAQPSLHIDQEEYSGKLSLRISKHLHKRVSELSVSQNISINALINDALSTYTSYLENNKNLADLSLRMREELDEILLTYAKQIKGDICRHEKYHIPDNVLHDVNENIRPFKFSGAN